MRFVCRAEQTRNPLSIKTIIMIKIIVDQITSYWWNQYIASASNNRSTHPIIWMSHSEWLLDGKERLKDYNNNKNGWCRTLFLAVACVFRISFGMLVTALSESWTWFFFLVFLFWRWMLNGVRVRVRCVMCIVRWRRRAVSGVRSARAHCHAAQSRIHWTGENEEEQ